MIPLDSIENKFSFVLAAAKRARQLQMGARPLAETHYRKPTRVAIEEILSQAVQYELVKPGEEDGETGREKKGKRGK